VVEFSQKIHSRYHAPSVVEIRGRGGESFRVLEGLRNVFRVVAFIVALGWLEKQPAQDEPADSSHSHQCASG
jgi:hypothetical protein